MAVPKKRTSVSRRGMRNSHRKSVKPVNLTECKNCGAFKLQHHVCSCGVYGDKVIFKTKNVSE